MSGSKMPGQHALVDGFGRRHTYLRISVTDRCNLRCRYCLPPDGIAHRERAEVLRFDEIVRLATVFAGVGVTKVRLTGGEPLVRRGIVDLVSRLADIPGIEHVCLTTNGVLLSEYAEPLRAAGLSRVNVSLDTLRPERFAHITLRDEYHHARAGLDAALATGFVPLRVNVVVIGGINDDELVNFVGLARESPLSIRFIEYMPFCANGWTAGRFVSCAAMRSVIEQEHSLVPVPRDIQGAQVVREFRIDGFRGTIGFISPMSDHFCGSCNRLRLTADGSLKSCLFFPGEVSLRDALRSAASDSELLELIAHTLAAKRWAHPRAEELANCESLSMIEIGG